MITDDRQDSFVRAFHTMHGGCRETCECGKTYYNPTGGWDWEEGELDELDKDPNAISVDCSVTSIRFEGKEYVEFCDCWHERAERIMGFIDSHNIQIAEYLNMERMRKLFEAEINNPSVGPIHKSIKNPIRGIEWKEDGRKVVIKMESGTETEFSVVVPYQIKSITEEGKLLKARSEEFKNADQSESP